MSTQLSVKNIAKTDRRFLNRECATTKLLEIVNVDPKWSEHVRVMDRDGSLVLLHYITTIDPETGVIDEEPLKAIGHVRGTVIDTTTDLVVSRSFPYTPEITSDAVSEYIADLTSVTAFNACEGTIVRLYFFGDEWKVSTHRKIDAHQSSWAGPSFGDLFDKHANDKIDLKTLDKRYSYVFLLSDNSNRLVYTIPTPQLMLLGVFNVQEQRFMTDDEYTDILPAIKRPAKLQISNNEELDAELKSQIQASDFSRSGILLTADQTNPHPLKVVTPLYQDIRRVRGNNPSLRSRYIHIRGTSDEGILREWYNMPEHLAVYSQVENDIDILIDKLHKMYINRYVKKNFGELPKEEFVTLQRCHSWHVSDRSKNIVTAQKVREIVNTTPGYYLALMLNRLTKELAE